MISIGSYIDFLLKFTLAFAIVFELPLAITLAARLGLVTPKALARNRKYAVLGAFVASAVLTPTPDAFNQLRAFSMVTVSDMALPLRSAKNASPT